MSRILFVFGTRPEAIKLAPLAAELASPRWGLEPRICVTAQHRGLLDQVLGIFRIEPHHDLDLMRPAQTLAQSASSILASLEPVIGAEQPACVVVQGDTTTAFCAALAGFYAGVPVAHVEAGLRTGNLQHPYPEELNRTLIGRIASHHLAPTESARQNLLREGVAEHSIHVTGNTGIDAILQTAARLGEQSRATSGKKNILVTAHRRESFGEGFESICRALRSIAQRGDVEITYPVHPNPQVRSVVERNLSNTPGITLLEPADYPDFVRLMMRSDIVLTDSGGIQEEAPSLGKPVIVMRATTERPEAVEAGTAVLAGTDQAAIVRETERLLDDPQEYARRSHIHNPFGDGRASERIARILQSHYASTR